MKKMVLILANLIWILVNIKDALLFRYYAGRTEEAQKKILQEIIGANRQTKYGRRYDFSALRSVDDYRKKVPITSYADYSEYIQRILSGEQNVLTKESVSVLEPTSGSTDGTKYIPYAKSLQKEFGRGIAPWVIDLFFAHPRMILGSSYWSITPSVKKACPQDLNVTIGFKDDSEYFGRVEKWMIGILMAVPKEISQINNTENFWYATALFLLRDQRLSFISVWNPTFLLLLIEKASLHWEELLKDLESGIISFPEAEDGLALRSIQKRLRPDLVRVMYLRKCQNDDTSLRWDKIWPNLRVISCWGSERALPYLQKLERNFTQVVFQAKGLIATEGFITFPLESIGFALSIRSHFFEFEEVLDHGERDELRLAHELEEGKEYSVIITTGGGLYRYRLGDTVAVDGWHKQCPLLEFRGRGQFVSDLFGEKLDECFVQKILSEELSRLNVRPDFSMIAPEKNEASQAIAYTLFLEVTSDCCLEYLRKLKSHLEQRLCDNFHYAYCRKLGQLSSFRLFLINSFANEAYMHGCISLGQKLGNIKPQLLRKELGWSSQFVGDYLN